MGERALSLAPASELPVESSSTPLLSAALSAAAAAAAAAAATPDVAMGPNGGRPPPAADPDGRVKAGTAARRAAPGAFPAACEQVHTEGRASVKF